MRYLLLGGILLSSLVLAAPAPFAVSSVISPDGLRSWRVQELTEAQQKEQQASAPFFSNITNQDFYPGLETDTPPIAAFSSDGNLLVYSYSDEIQVLDLKQKKFISSFKYPKVYKMAFFGQNLLLVAKDSDLMQVSSITGKLGAKFKFVGIGTNLEQLSLSADGKRGVILLYSKGATFANVVDFTKNIKVLSTVGGIKTGSFTACAVNANGSSFVCGADEGSIAVFNATGKISRTFKAFKTAVQSVVFTKTGGIFASSENSVQTFK